MYLCAWMNRDLCGKVERNRVSGYFENLMYYIVCESLYAWKYEICFVCMDV